LATLASYSKNSGTLASIVKRFSSVAPSYAADEPFGLRIAATITPASKMKLDLITITATLMNLFIT
jgi:hypothetical protein